KKLSDFIGLSNVVLFNPDDIQFFVQAPRKRRKEIDYELGKSSKTYLQNLLHVNQYLQNRNAYLKQHQQDPIYLDTLDQQIADLSELIIIKRLEFTKYMSSKTNKYYQQFTDSHDLITLTYECCVDLEKDNYNHALLNKMKDNRQRDLDLKMTNVGIHRDDFIFKINDDHVVDVMSQGQRRMMMIAYKLAIIDWFMELNQKKPIFCMDDLFSELDEEKRNLVLKHLHKDLQIFITTTDLDFIQTNKDKKIFEIEKGKVRRSLNG
ncbi:MAG TPA: DNA replication and repair protein RecF, partial [Erysipelothrix sp.]|nr:DNA replication and repair protein RecF [Erysipelothrix sp.]